MIFGLIGELWLDEDVENSFMYMLNDAFFGWLLVLDEKDSRKIDVEFSDSTDSLILFKFLWNIGVAKISKTFTVGSSLCFAIFCKFLWILDVYFMSYKFVNETTQLVVA